MTVRCRWRHETCFFLIACEELGDSAACVRNWQWRLTELTGGGALSRAGGVYRRRGLSCGGAGARRAPALLKAARGILPELWCWGGPRAAWDVSLRGRAAERRLWARGAARECRRRQQDAGPQMATI
ncbi:hypothetical protein NDU88_010176 [Pleurodeles waltl]|uniref:Uncharacterized protein n=1 Tax=Pleurodeles waltl TaxID=8319 RepID=A0AAV7PXA7_PLEWA|nr:hypothetical protein NDU88_010176 [Pleurodeles waltl]